MSALSSSASAVRTLSAFRSDAPRLHHALRRRVPCKDALCLFAFDSDLHGVLLVTPTRRRISLNAKAEKRWRTLASHIGAADRLRRALGRSNQERLIPITALPRELRSARASSARAASPGTSVRDAAARVDGRSAEMPRDQTGRAREVLRGLVQGELSMVDWFVRDGRCFTLARRSDPTLGDPRALTAREKQVVFRTARGESRKLVAHDLRIDRTRVSRLLASAMRKLGVRNQTELVVKVRCLERHGLLCDQ